MQEVVANVDNIKFDIEIAIKEQYGVHPLPFPGMDKSGAGICTFFIHDVCNLGAACPFRHVRGDQTVVCKHWLRGLCKKGDDCEFLHEYDMSKMPECYFYSRFGQCSNKECPFLHIDPESKIKDCPWYDRGFCRHGPVCKNRHVRRIMCPNFVCGFCPLGNECKFAHPTFELPQMDTSQKTIKSVTICHNCGEVGHKVAQCFKELGTNLTGMSHNVDSNMTKYMTPHDSRGPRRPLNEVTCHKCGDKGHFANRCPKGHLAFLHHPPT